MSNSVQTPEPKINSIQTPEPMMKKKDVAKFLQCSERQVELLVKAGKLPKPFYISDASPKVSRRVATTTAVILSTLLIHTPSRNRRAAYSVCCPE